MLLFFQNKTVDPEFSREEAIAMCRKEFDKLAFMQQCEEYVIDLEQDMDSCAEDLEVYIDHKLSAK